MEPSHHLEDSTMGKTQHEVQVNLSIARKIILDTSCVLSYILLPFLIGVPPRLQIPLY